MNENKKLSGKYIMVLIAMCGLIAICLGMMVNIAGLFFTPIADEFHTGRGVVSMTLTILNLVQAVAGMVAGKVLNEKSFRKVVVIGVLGAAVSTFLLSVSQNMALLYLLNGVRGFCGGLIGSVVVTRVINNWFDERRGLMTSIAFSASGIAGAIFSIVFSAIITSLGWRSGYMIQSLIILVLGSPAMFFPIAMTPELVGMKPFGYHVDEAMDKKTDATSSGNAAPLSKLQFVFMVLFGICAAYLTAFPQHFTGMAATFSKAAVIGATMMSICMIVNTVGKILLGILIDAIGTKKATLTFSSLIAVGFLAILINQNDVFLFAAAALIGLSYSVSTVGVAMLTRALFGQDNYGRVFPTVNLGLTLANAIGTSIIGYLYDFTKGYTVAVIVSIVMVLISIFLVFIMYARHKDLKTETVGQ